MGDGGFCFWINFLAISAIFCIFSGFLHFSVRFLKIFEVFMSQCL